MSPDVDRDPVIHELFDRCYGGAGSRDRVRACGRVNLIGEHLDYNGLAVLPMVIDRGITLLFRRRTDDRVRLRNVDPAYGPIDCTIAGNAGPGEGGWIDLVRAAGRALADRFEGLCGLDGIVDADLPAAAGLSSSTALVVAVARAIVSVNDLRVEPLALIQWLSDAERTVGVPGGAMDQAVCLAGRPRTALKIEFEPLALTEIPVPAHWQFVVANSLVVADKAGSVERACRERVAECRVVLETLSACGIPGAGSYRGLMTGRAMDELSSLADRLPAPVLRRRYAHVIGESRRVSQAESMLRQGDIAGFGRLMTESHRSLRDDFDVSHPRLDRLVEACLVNGALGARLTGAGFGGSVVALCDGSADALIDALARDFYAGREDRAGVERVLFRA